MDIVVTGRHLTVSDRFRAHIEEKLAKVTQLAPRTRRVEVLISHEPNKRQAKSGERVEITCYAKGPVVRAEACVEALAERERIVAVAAHQGRQVERGDLVECIHHAVTRHSVPHRVVMPDETMAEIVKQRHL